MIHTGNRISELLKEKNKSVPELADVLEISKQSTYKMLKRPNIDTAILETICNFLGISIITFFQEISDVDPWNDYKKIIKYLDVFSNINLIGHIDYEADLLIERMDIKKIDYVLFFETLTKIMLSNENIKLILKYKFLCKEDIQLEVYRAFWDKKNNESLFGFSKKQANEIAEFANKNYRNSYNRRIVK